MASTYTNSGFELIGDDEQFETWGYTENTNKELIDEAVNGVISLALINDVDLVTVVGVSGSTFADAGRHKVIQLTGSPGAVRTVTIVPNTLQKVYIVENQTDQDVVIAQGSGSSVTILSKHNATVYCDGGGTTASVYLISSSVETLTIAVSDETTDLTTGVEKVTFRIPYDFLLTDVRASVSAAPVGANLIIDVNASAVSLLSSKLVVDANDTTSVGSSNDHVISTAELPDDVEITIDIDQVGAVQAGKGLKVSLIGRKQ